MEQILELHNLGFNSEQISEKLGLEKKEVEYYLIDNLETRSKKLNKTRLKEILELRYKGMSFEKIAPKYAISGALITKCFKNLGIKFPNAAYRDKSCLTPENIEIIISRFNEGDSIRTLAKDYNLNVDIISKLLRKNGVDPTISFDINIFHDIDTEEKAYWLGFMYADGNVSKNTTGIEIGLAAYDIEHLVKFANFCKSKRVPKLYPDRSRFSIGNAQTKADLISHGCVPAKSLILTFPNAANFKDESLIRHFIRGYFDGDGCISYTYTNPGKSEKITISCDMIGTNEFLMSAKEYLLELGISGNIVHSERFKNNTATLEFSKNNSVKLVNFLYEDCSIYLTRKYSRYTYFKENNFAVLKSDFKENDRVISEKAKEYIQANAEITFEYKKSKVS